MSAKSTASPIYVNFLGADDTGLPGHIGLTIAPGKKDVFTARDLDADLDRLRDEYCCDLLVSLLEPQEYGWLGIADLFESAARHGIDTVHFPIPDGSTPVPEEMPSFTELVEKIVGAARAGKTVVIHCRGGLGRTGTVAACCLVALGHGPADAVQSVRAVRPGAVETYGQERWVAAFAQVVGPLDVRGPTP
jgi:protein-tyrosine phosphatase